MLNGKYNLCLTVEFLMFFDDLNRNLNNDICEESFKEKYQTKVDRLRASFKNLNLLKVTGSLRESIKLKFDLRYFTSLKSLELENVYLDNILNLSALVPQLTTVKLNRCLSKKPFEEFLTREVWSALNCLSISRAVFANEQFDFVPNSVQSLQLQWNQIQRFTINSSTRSNLTELDLSFNKLKQIPHFGEKELICSTLKVLKLRGNLIDSFRNVENFHQLEHLDVSVNQICNKDEIGRYLSFCKKLKTLNLIDNPVQMLDTLNVLVLETFPALRKLNNHICYSERSSEKDSTTSSNANADLFSDFEDKNSVVSKNDESISSRQASTRRRDRVAVILDRTNSFANTDDEQPDQDRLSAVSSVNKGLSLGLENNFTDLNEIIAAQRKSLGKKLLSKPASGLVVPYSTPVDCSNFSIVGEIHKLDSGQSGSIPVISPDIEQVKTKIQNLATNQAHDQQATPADDSEEDGLVFSVSGANLAGKSDGDRSKSRPSPTKPNEKKSNEQQSSPSSSPKEDNLWANEDMEGDNIFLVNKLDSNLVESSEPIFILVKDSLIYEKDCATGKIFEVYDLKVITDYELEDSTTISLTFDSKIKSKQKVVYNLELDSQLDKFKRQFIEPFVTRNQEEKANQRFKYECLKCGSKSAQQTECGQCKSTALIECTDGPNAASNDNRPAYTSQSSYKEEFLNQVKLKLTNEQVPTGDEASDVSDGEERPARDELANGKAPSDENDREAKEDEPSGKDEEPDEEEVTNLINSKLENYELEQFTSVEDHELKLHLDVKIFANNERLDYLFECDFSINDTSEMAHGRIATTNTCLHLISCRSEAAGKQDHAFDTFTMPLNKIKNVKLTRDHFFHQCIWLNIERQCGKKKKRKNMTEVQTFFIILKDKKLVDLFCDYLESFLNKQEIKLKTNTNTYSVSEKKLELDTEENIIFSQFIVSLTTKSDSETSKSSPDNLLCLLFEKGAEIILARCEVIANELKFQKICRNDLTNLICAKLQPEQCDQLHLFFSDSNNQKIEWIVGAYSVNSMFKIVDLVKTVWESIYQVPLQIFTK